MKSTASELDWKSWVLFNSKIAIFPVNPCHGRAEISAEGGKKQKSDERFINYVRYWRQIRFHVSIRFVAANAYHEKHFFSVVCQIENRSEQMANENST